MPGHILEAIRPHKCVLCGSRPKQLEKERNEKRLARVTEPEWIERASTIARVRIKLNIFRNILVR